MSRRSPVFTVVALSQLCGIVLALLFLPFLGRAAPVLPDLLFGLGAGIFGSLGLLLLYKGLAENQAALVSPTSAVLGAVVPMSFGLLIGDSPSPAVWAGCILCLSAILLISKEKKGSAAYSYVRKGLAYGLASGLGFGAFFILLSRTGSSAGIWPLIAARTASISIVMISIKARKVSLKPVKGDILLIILTGLADMGANIAFLFAVRQGMLLLVSIITSLYPVPTVLLARFILRQKMGPARVLGLILACAGVACISLG